MRSHCPWANVIISGLSLPMRHSYENEWVFYYHVNTNVTIQGHRVGIRKVTVPGAMSYTAAVKQFVAELREFRLFSVYVDAVVTTQYNKADYSTSPEFDKEFMAIR